MTGSRVLPSRAFFLLSQAQRAGVRAAQARLPSLSRPPRAHPLPSLSPLQKVIVRRGEPIPATPAGPIVVATRNDALAGVVEAMPPTRRGDLVFIQNGHLQPWLDGVGLGDATQVLVYFAVAAAGDAPTDGVTEANPEGLTAATGKWAPAVAARLNAAGLACKVLPKANFDKAMLEKLVWIRCASTKKREPRQRERGLVFFARPLLSHLFLLTSFLFFLFCLPTPPPSAFMLVGAKHGGITVGEVESAHTAEVAALITELTAAGAADMGLAMDDEPTVTTRLLAYARAVAHFPTAVKEFQWRNGYFWKLSQAAAAGGKADPCPLHSALLKEVGAV